MRKYTTLLFFWLALMGSTMAQAPQKVASKIDEVTVYLEGAIVKRVATTTLATGVTELIFENFPANLNSDLIQVKAENQVKLLDVNYRLLTTDEKKVVSMETLNEKAKGLRDQLDAIAVKQAVLQTDLNFIQDRNTLYRNNDNPSAQQMREMDAYLSQRRLAIRTEMLQQEQKQESLNKAIQKINAEIKEITLANLSPKYALVVRVDAATAGRKNFEITYFTPQAGWTPSYQVRVASLEAPVSFELTAGVDQESGEDWDNVQLKLSTGNPSVGATLPEMNLWPLRPNERYYPTKSRSPQATRRSGSGQLAGYVIDQNTGAPVPFASLELRDRNQQRTVVTANKEGKFTAKELPVGFYNVTINSSGYNTKNEVIQISRGREHNEIIYLSAKTRNRYSNDDVLVNAVSTRDINQIASQSPGVFSSDEGQATFVKGGRANSKSVEKVEIEDYESAEEQFTTMLYTIEKRHTIPGTGMPRDIQVSKATIPADFVHISRPALDDGAFLQAYITDWEALRLLKGKALLYLEDAYMGTTVIDPMETKDTLKLSLGRDPQVIVKRERTLNSSSKSFFGTTIREQFSYKIDVRNTKRVAIRLIVEDQIPISQHKDIVVAKVEMTPTGTLDAEKGFIHWELPLNSNSSNELRFNFEVSRPKDMPLFNIPKY